MITKSKWFYEAQDAVSKKMDAMYDERMCNWQVVTKDRIVEHWTAFKRQGKSHQVMVVIQKSGNRSHAARHFIYTIDPIAWGDTIK